MSGQQRHAIFDRWAEFIIRTLKAESELAGFLLGHKGELGDAREALIKDVLTRIVPSSYEIGTGEIIDAGGGRSDQIDIVIARRDAPSLSLPSGSKTYLVESVLATIEVKSIVNKESLTKALNNSASVAALTFNVTKESYDQMCLKPEPGKVLREDGLYFDDILEAQRFILRGRPVSYIFGFRGYSEDIEQFANVIGAWGYDRVKRDLGLGLPVLPAVIASERFVALRNASPYTRSSAEDEGNERALYLIGEDSTPLRILISHLLHTLCSGMVPDQFGLIINPSMYLAESAPFDFTRGVFDVPKTAASIRYPFEAERNIQETL